MAKAPAIESLLKSGASEWNKLRRAGKVPTDHTGATFAQLFSANADLSGLGLIGTEWDKCDLSKINFNFHAEHHLWPFVSYQYLPVLHERLLHSAEAKQMGVTFESSYAAAIQKLWSPK